MHSPSVNIIRDVGKKLHYITTPNAERVANSISHDFKKGIHAFTLIGSYGTGKSSFLWALEKSILDQTPFKIDLGFKPKTIETFRFVGQYQSLIEQFRDHFDLKDDFQGNQKILDKLFEAQEKVDLLVVYIDEFGKFLEYAAKHEPEKELYFLQQLAEFTNDENRNVLLVNTLHQNFEAYAEGLPSGTLKAEWKKIRGRLQELTFNEPAEQLLYLAAKRLKGKSKGIDSKIDLAKKHHILSRKTSILDELKNELSPLDAISARVLVEALKEYGQNERSLFSFLESESHEVDWFSVADVFDYLNSAFYSYINSPGNRHFRQWQLFQNGLDRIQIAFEEGTEHAEKIFKTIALLQVFTKEGAEINVDFLKAYHTDIPSVKIEQVLRRFKELKIAMYRDYSKSIRMIEGTDVDFDQALIQAAESVELVEDIVPLLQSHFEFPYLQAKAVSYEKGTPRIFQYEIASEPTKNTAQGAIDGIVNLIFNELITEKQIQFVSKNQEEAILYVLFLNTTSIKDHLFEIQKTQKALAKYSDDTVAKNEFNKILDSRNQLLTHEVLDAIYTDKVVWYFGGNKVPIQNPNQLNKLLSKVCNEVYFSTPTFINELVNKHKISTSIHTARKNYFESLCLNWKDENLGYSDDKFPPDKTIYLSLLQATSIHKNGHFVVPDAKTNPFYPVWKACLDFIESTREEPKFISDLISILDKKPFKLKQGLIDFWIPTFLFIQRNNFAVYEHDRNGVRFIAELNKDFLYMITRNPENYSLKAFQISGLRLDLFNRYREVTLQTEVKQFSNEAFIESVRPFLLFYKQLNEYARTTKRLSLEAIALREAIATAKDPEQTFFEIIPRALGSDLSTLAESDKALSEFAIKLNDGIEELKTAYDELLNRLELFIQLEIIGKKLEFKEYKKLFQKRFDGIKEHRLLNTQKVFLQRMQSALDDRDSWLASIAQALLSKPLNRIQDVEEDVLRDRFAHMVKELDNLKLIHADMKDETDEVLRFDFTSLAGMKSKNIRIPEGKKDEVDQLAAEIETKLGKQKQLKLAVLAQLLKKELDK